MNESKPLERDETKMRKYTIYWEYFFNISIPLIFIILLTTNVYISNFSCWETRNYNVWICESPSLYIMLILFGGLMVIQLIYNIIACGIERDEAFRIK